MYKIVLFFIIEFISKTQNAYEEFKFNKALCFPERRSYLVFKIMAKIVFLLTQDSLLKTKV